ncbi:permease [Ignavibacteria bacterium 4148-Me]|uniref:permease n=1 Tax=Rosettibacter primus TaxID=3111523 RepID=UPI00247CCAC9|nr:permease [Ignavibacteria bacterium]
MFFLFAYFLPIENDTFRNAIIDAFALAKWYAQEHVLLCLVPAFFIAGVIAVFISQVSVIKHFSVKAKKWKAYLVAAGSGTIFGSLFLYRSSAFFFDT